MENKGYRLPLLILGALILVGGIIFSCILINQQLEAKQKEVDLANQRLDQSNQRFTDFQESSRQALLAKQGQIDATKEQVVTKGNEIDEGKEQLLTQSTELDINKEELVAKNKEMVRKDAELSQLEVATGQEARENEMVYSPPASGPVGWWKFDEGTGLAAADSSSNGYNASLNNNPLWVKGINGNALSFDGYSQYVSTNYSGVLGKEARTITAWVKTNQTFSTSGNYSAILSYGNSRGTCGSGFQLDTYDNYGGWGPASGKTGISVDLWCSAITYEAPGLYDNNWHFIAVSVPQSSALNHAQVYLDGALLSTVNVEYSSTIPIKTTNEDTVNIGSFGGKNFFKGSLEDVRIYNRALSGPEIQALYSETKASGK